MSAESTRQAEAEFRAALAAQNAGKRGEAEKLYQRVLNRDPKHVPALHNLAVVLAGSGRPGAAYPYLKLAIELDGKAAESRNALGNVLWDLGLKSEAEEQYARAAELRPDYAAAWRGLGRVAQDAGRLNEAETFYRKAIAANPRYAEVLTNLGSILRHKNREEAIALTRRALEVDRKSAVAHNNLGNFLRDMDRLDEAAKCYETATECDPEGMTAWLNLGTVLNQLGRAEQAAVALRRAIALNPKAGEPYFQLAVTVKLKPDDAAVTAMRGLYEDRRTPDRERMYLAFGLGRVFDENKRHDDAFACWHVGNRLKRASLRFDIRNEEAFAARMRNLYTKELLHSGEKSKVTDNTPIFIVGMIRSGTTLMEQILASHPQVVGADENTILAEVGRTIKAYTEPEFTRIGETYIRRMRDRYGTSPRITDKLVGNWLYIGLIHMALPNAKIICMRRNPYDSCISAYGSLFTAHHEYCYGMAEVAKFYTIFNEMIAYWDAVLPGKVYQQSYEKLVAETEPEVRKILEFCELPFDERCLAFHQTDRRVRTASTQQVREKMHGRSVERWRNYGHHIDAWRPILGDPEAWSRP